MPTYNYHCNNCDNNYSYFQKMSEQSLTKCENCGGKINRIISGGSGLIFKGSGFYLTDYKNDTKKVKDKNENKKNSIKKDNKNSRINSQKDQSSPKKVEKKSE